MMRVLLNIVIPIAVRGEDDGETVSKAILYLHEK